MKRHKDHFEMSEGPISVKFSLGDILFPKQFDASQEGTNNTDMKWMDLYWSTVKRLIWFPSQIMFVPFSHNYLSAAQLYCIM